MITLRFAISTITGMSFFFFWVTTHSLYSTKGDTARQQYYLYHSWGVVFFFLATTPHSLYSTKSDTARQQYYLYHSWGVVFIFWVTTHSLYPSKSSTARQQHKEISNRQLFTVTSHIFCLS